MIKQWKITFPEGMAVTVTFGNGKTISGNFKGNYSTETTQVTVLLSFPIAEHVVEQFSASLPPVIIDGERIEPETVQFKRAKESWYGVINC